MRQRRESNSVSTVIVPARLRIRIAEPPDDVSGAMSIERFIELLEDFENNRHADTERTDTRYMITRIRKIFYGKDSWDEHLIPRARLVDRPYVTGEVENSRFALALPWLPDLIDVVRKRYEVRDSAFREPEIYRGRELRLQNRLYCDIGHVFAGLDALNHPGNVGLAPVNITITRNVDAVTWIGDLGSVLAEWKFKRFHPNRGNASPLSITEAQAIIDEYAPHQDMLGNIDAYAIQSEFNITGRRPPTMRPPSASWRGHKVSEILKAYYLRDNPARQHRYSRFARAIGLTGWNGTQFSNESARINYYIDEVQNAAALYVGANTAETWYGFIPRRSFALGIAYNQGAEILLRAFFRELKVKRSQESQN